MKKLIIIICLVTFRIAQANESIIKMEIKPDTINIGQFAILTWQVTNAERIYISTLGKVNPSGSQKISPDKTTIISIIAEGIGSISSKSKEVVIMGTRGESLCPDEHLLQYPFTYKKDSVNYTDVLDVIHDVLQDTMGFSIYSEHQLHNGPYIFLTNYSQKSYLVGGNERTIGARRIAYAVEIKMRDCLNHNVEYVIKSAIQYRLKIGKVWRQETNEQFYLREAQRLKKNVDKILLKYAFQ